MILRGDAHAAFSQQLQAAVDYQAVFLQFPTSDQAWKAGEKLEALRGPLGGKFPIISLDHQIEHANTIYGAHQWSNARNEYSKLLTEATGAQKERAELRILACGVALGGNPVSMIALSIADPDVDAERVDRVGALPRWELFLGKAGSGESGGVLQTVGAELPDVE